MLSAAQSMSRSFATKLPRALAAAPPPVPSPRPLSTLPQYTRTLECLKSHIPPVKTGLGIVSLPTDAMTQVKKDLGISDSDTYKEYTQLSTKMRETGISSGSVNLNIRMSLDPKMSSLNISFMSSIAALSLSPIQYPSLSAHILFDRACLQLAFSHDPVFATYASHGDFTHEALVTTQADTQYGYGIHQDGYHFSSIRTLSYRGFESSGTQILAYLGDYAIPFAFRPDSAHLFFNQGDKLDARPFLKPALQDPTVPVFKIAANRDFLKTTFTSKLLEGSERDGAFEVLSKRSLSDAVLPCILLHAAAGRSVSPDSERLVINTSLGRASIGSEWDHLPKPSLFSRFSGLFK